MAAQDASWVAETSPEARGLTSGSQTGCRRVVGLGMGRSLGTSEGEKSIKGDNHKWVGDHGIAKPRAPDGKSCYGY